MGSYLQDSDPPLMLFARAPSTLAGSNISSRRVFYKSTDGTRVPLFITAKGLFADCGGDSCPAVCLWRLRNLAYPTLSS